MSDPAIRAALETRLKTWADAQAPPVPIAWEDVPYTPTGARYVRAFLLPAETQTPAMTADYRLYAGLMQVSICVPSGQGPGASDALYESLKSSFDYQTKLTATGGFTVLINRVPAKGPVMLGDGYRVLPVSIYYRADLTT